MPLSLEHLQLLTNAKLTPDQLAAVMQVISPLLEMIEKRRAARGSAGVAGEETHTRHS